jgi:hypothetical protein
MYGGNFDIYGRPLDMYDRLIDESGRLIDEQGRRIDENGTLIQEAQPNPGVQENKSSNSQYDMSEVLGNDFEEGK